MSSTRPNFPPDSRNRTVFQSFGSAYRPFDRNGMKKYGRPFPSRKRVITPIINGSRGQSSSENNRIPRGWGGGGGGVRRSSIDGRILEVKKSRVHDFFGRPNERRKRRDIDETQEADEQRERLRERKKKLRDKERR